MLNEERILSEKYGRRNPFKVPEEYFDHLADKMTVQVAEKEPAKTAGIHFFLPCHSRSVILTAAASVCFAVFGVTAYLHHEHKSYAGTAVHLKVNESKDDYFNDAVDYAMMDTEDMYASLADSK